MSRAAARAGRGSLGRVLLVLGGLALGCALAEGLSRGLSGRPDAFLLAPAPSTGMEAILGPHPELLWAPVPGAQAVVEGLEHRAQVRINALGLRGPEPAPVDPRQKRVLVLGDSFVLASQVAEEQSLSARLDEALGPEVHVYNGGVDGYGTQQATRRLELLQGPLRLDAAVLVFFLGNDLWENARYAERRAEALAGTDRGSKDRGNPLHAWLLGHSHAYARGLVSLRAALGRAPAEVQERYRQELQLYTTDPLLDTVLPDTRQALDGFSRACAAAHLRCLVALAPPSLVVHPERAAATLQAFGLDPATLDLDRPARAVAQVLPPGLPAVDLEPALRSAEAPAYFVYDGHWTAEGHARAAEALLDPLRDLLASR